MRTFALFAAALVMSFGINTCASGPQQSTPVPPAVSQPQTRLGSPTIFANATPTSAIAKPSAGQEIFTLGEVTYKEHPSAKGKIRADFTRPVFSQDGRRYFQATIQNVSQTVLDVVLHADWKDPTGNVVKEDQAREPRFIPGQPASFWRGNSIQFPQGASNLEFWIEAKTPQPLPSSVTVNYAEEPSVKGLVKLLDYKIEIDGKGTPLERWSLVNFTIKNVSGFPLGGIDFALGFDVPDSLLEKQALILGDIPTPIPTVGDSTPRQVRGLSLGPNQTTSVTFSSTRLGGEHAYGGWFPFDATGANLRLEKIGDVRRDEPFSLRDLGLEKVGIRLLDYRGTYVPRGQGAKVDVDVSTENASGTGPLVIYDREKKADGTILMQVNKKEVPRGAKKYTTQFSVGAKTAILELDIEPFIVTYRTPAIKYKVIFDPRPDYSDVNPQSFIFEESFSRENDVEMVGQEARIIREPGKASVARFSITIRNTSNRVISVYPVGGMAGGRGVALAGTQQSLQPNETKTVDYSVRLDDLSPIKIGSPQTREAGLLTYLDVTVPTK